MRNHTGAQPAGIRGWLLCFVIISIIGILYRLSPIREILEMADRYPALTGGVYALIALEALWCLFFVYCIYLIVNIHKNAIKLTKIALLINPLLAVAIPMLVLIFYSLSSGVSLINSATVAASYDHAIGDILKAVIFSGIWYRYFCVSVRVKNTWAIHDNKLPNS